MSLETFLHNLHFDTKKAGPPDWQVDWKDKPFAYKLYRGLPVVPLSPEVPLTLEERQAPVKAGLREIGHFLWYVYGLTQFCQSVFPLDSKERAGGLMQSNRRYVPSGGALYPNELYVYLRLDDLPAGVYHYDVAHHRLVLLREGNFDSYLQRALGNRCDVTSCFGTVFVSTRFWKNFYKYNNFAYRLQGLDTGVLIGQLLEVANRFGFASFVYFRFLDLAVNHLLGLSANEESVYAVIPLASEPSIMGSAGETHGLGPVSATDLCRELPAVRHCDHIGSRKGTEYPMLTEMNEACLLESLPSVPPIKEENMDPGKNRMIQLPRVERLSYDLASVCRERYSPNMDFVLDKISQSQLATLLQEATSSFGYRNDLDGPCDQPGLRVFLYVCLHSVEGIPDGAYCYDSAARGLLQLRPGDHRPRLQKAMSLDNVNLFQVPLCFHVAGNRDHLGPVLGYRGYRIQQMEAGMRVQRLLLAASAIGMGGHPLLGYDVNLVDELYQTTPGGKTSLIQIPVGPYRHRPCLAGNLYG